MVFGQATERVAIRVTYQRTDRSRISDCPTARKRESKSQIERPQKSQQMSNSKRLTLTSQLCNLNQLLLSRKIQFEHIATFRARKMNEPARYMNESCLLVAKSRANWRFVCFTVRPTKFALGSQAERLEFEWALVLRNSLP